MHIGIANRQRTSQKFNDTRRMTIAIDKAVFIVTDLKKYTSYEDEIKSCVELKKRSNFDAGFKPDRNFTAKL